MPSVKVDILGDSSSLQRAYRAAAEATKSFGRHTTESATSVKKLEGAVESAHTKMLGFAKSTLLAGAALVGAGSVYEGLKTTITAAEGFNVAQRQLQAQLKANGESFKAVAPWVDKLRTSQERLGFDMTQTTDAFTKLDRASGSSAVAYKYMSTAADLARTRNIDLGLAAQLVGKIIQGNTNALNRFGIILPKNISSTEALALVNKRLAGQAAAAVTPFNRLHAALHDIEIQIGNALMPVITRYLDRVTEWLSQANHQRQIISFVKTAMHDLGVAVKTASRLFEEMRPTLTNLAHLFINGVKTAIDAARTAFDFLARTFGKHKVEMVAAITAIGVAITLAIGPEAVAIVGAIIAVGYIRKHWGDLKDFFKTLMQEISNILTYAWDQIEIGAIKAARAIVEPFSHLPSKMGQWARDAKDNFNAELAKIKPPDLNWSAAAAQAGVTAGTVYAHSFQAAAKTTLVGAGIEPGDIAGPVAPDTTTGAPPGSTTVVGDAAARAAAQKAAAAAARKAAAEARRAAAAFRRRLRADIPGSVSGEAEGQFDFGGVRSAQRAQFTALGLGARGTGQSPLSESLRHELNRIKTALSGTLLDTNKNTHLLTQVGKVLEGKFGEITDRTRAAIRKLLGTLDSELKKGKGFGPTGRVISAEALTAGLGLTGDARRTAEARIAQAIAHGGMVPAGPTLQGVAPITVHTTVNLDGRKVAHSVTQHQEQLGRYQTPQRRGMNAGRGRYLP
jgi:hypothetical protein